MSTLLLESDDDVIDLDGQKSSGEGFQAHAGALGFGIPDADVQWFDGAGSGSVYRGRRVQPREFDLPVSILTDGGPEALQSYIDRLSVVLAKPARLVRVDEAGERWVVDVVLVSGGDYTMGEDTDGEMEWHATLQLRSGSSTWRRESPVSYEVASTPIAGQQPYGAVTIHNPGSAPAYPVWRVQGPGNTFRVEDENGEGFSWSGTLGANEALYVDTENGTVRDDAGLNIYKHLGPAPLLKPLQPGYNTWLVSLSGRSAGTEAALTKSSTTPNRINYMPSRPQASGMTTIRNNYCPNPRALGPGGSDDWWGLGGTSNVTIFTDSSQGPPDGATSYARANFTKIGYGTSGWLLSPVTASLNAGTYTCTAWVQADKTCEGQAYAVPVGGGTPSGTPLTLEAGVWTRISHTLTMPGGVPLRFGFQSNKMTSGQLLRLTSVLIEDTKHVRDYFDGSSPAPLPGLTAAWSGTANNSASVARGPSVVTSGTDRYQPTTGVKVWTNSNVMRALTETVSTVRYPMVDHALGDTWVSSFSVQSPTNAAARVYISAASVAGSPHGPAIARSSVDNVASGSYTRLMAAGDGTPPDESVQHVRPIVEFFTEDAYYQIAFPQLENSSSLLPYFNGDNADSLNEGIYEWEGAQYFSRSLLYDAHEERQSMTALQFNPRRWAVI